MKYKFILLSSLLLASLVPMSVQAHPGNHDDFRFRHRPRRAYSGCPVVQNKRDYQDWKWQLTRYSKRISRGFQKGIRHGNCYIFKLRTEDRTFLAIDRHNIRWATENEIRYFRKMRRRGNGMKTRDSAFVPLEKRRVRRRRFHKTPKVLRHPSVIFERF